MAARVQVSGSDDVRVLEAELLDTDGMLQAIGALLLSKAQGSWRKQARGGLAWGPRMVPNVPGIVADLNAGGKPKARRFQARPALSDTGRLKGSLTMRVSGDAVTVGTNIPYAALHNEGGETQVTLTPQGRRNLTELLRKERGGQKRRTKAEDKLEKKLAFSVDEGVQAELSRKLTASRAKGERSNMLLSLGWLFSRPSFAVNVRQRTFLTITDDDVSEIVALVEKEVARGIR